MFTSFCSFSRTKISRILDSELVQDRFLNWSNEVALSPLVWVSTSHGEGHWWLARAWFIILVAGMAVKLLYCAASDGRTPPSMADLCFFSDQTSWGKRSDVTTGLGMGLGRRWTNNLGLKGWIHQLFWQNNLRVLPWARSVVKTAAQKSAVTFF